jgi:hypothetical protein
MADGDAPTKRDVRNHVLFEIATEVANRGPSLCDPILSRYVKTLTISDLYLKWAGFTLCSSPKLQLPQQSMATDIR